MNEIKLEVTISLEDFFSSESDKAVVFQNALQAAIFEKLNQSEWVQSNIAYYLFERLKNEVFEKEFGKIQQAVWHKIQEFKEPSEWEVQHHPMYLVAMTKGLDSIAPEIQEATKMKALEFIADEGREYNSFYAKVAEAMVDRVMDNFVDAMVKKAA